MSINRTQVRSRAALNFGSGGAPRNWLVALGSRRVRALMDAPAPLSVQPLARA